MEREKKLKMETLKKREYGKINSTAATDGKIGRAWKNIKWMFNVKRQVQKENVLSEYKVWKLHSTADVTSSTKIEGLYDLIKCQKT